MPQDVTQLLIDWSAGDAQALDRLMPQVYAELRAVAGRHMRRERASHTLQATALVHEAFLRLVDQRRVRWRSRAHFFAVAAMAMRRLLVNHAEARNAAKRGGGAEPLPFDEARNISAPAGATNWLEVDGALEALRDLDDRQAKIVELRVFGGFTVGDAARFLEISEATVKRDWRLARAWLRQHLAAASFSAIEPAEKRVAAAAS